MPRTLLNGTKIISPTQELKNAFRERKPFLTDGWIILYLERFCQDFGPSEVARMTSHLYKVDNTNAPQAPRLSVLNNIDILMEENGWKTQEIETLLEWKQL